MSMFTLATSCLTTSNLLWFMNLTFQVPMQYYSLQHWTLLPSPVSSTTGYMYSPLYQSYVYTHLPFTSLKQFLRAIWNAISWAIVFILHQVKLTSQLLCGPFFFFFQSTHPNPIFHIIIHFCCFRFYEFRKIYEWYPFLTFVNVNSNIWITVS